jgi:hypothetical protein
LPQRSRSAPVGVSSSMDESAADCMLELISSPPPPAHS